MKYVYALLLTAMCFVTSTVSAQVAEKTMQMSAGEQSGLEVDLPIDKKQAEKLWKEYVKPYGKVDWDRKNKEHVLFDQRISSISSDPVTIVAKFNNYGKETKGAFWFKSGDEWLAADDSAIRGAGEFLQEYAYEAERHRIKGQIKTEEKGLGSMEKDLRKLVKKNDNLHKDIKKAKELIAKKEKEIEENLKAQEEKKEEIEGQKGKIQGTTESLGKVGKKD